MALNARNKGQRGEREVVKILQEVVDRVLATRPQCRPVVLQRNALQAHLGGEDIHGLDGFSVEVKFCETTLLKQWWAQCLRQAKNSNAVPILFYRKTKQRWSVVVRLFANTPKDSSQIEIDAEMSLEDFLSWFEDAYAESLEDHIPIDKPEVELPAITTYQTVPCTCVTNPLSQCPVCHV